MVDYIYSFIATVLYATIAIFSIIGTILYYYAWKEMKRTPVIFGIMLLLLTLSIDTCWWTFTEFMRFMSGRYSDILIHPISLILIKGILLIGILYFVQISVKIQKGGDCI